MSWHSVGAPTVVSADEVVEHWLPVEERESWIGVGGELTEEHGVLRYVARDGFPGGRAMLRRGVLDPTRFNRVRVRLCGPGNARLQVRLEGRRAALVESSTVVVPPGTSPRAVVVELPRVPAERGPAVSLGLVLMGDVSRIDLLSVELLKTPLEALVSGAEAGASLVQVDTEARLGVGLVSGQTLETSFVATEGESLALAYARPVAARGTNGSRLVVELLDGGHQLLSREFGFHDAMPGRGGWSSAVLPLEGFSGRRLVARVQLQGNPTAAFVGDTRLVAARRAGQDEPPSVLLITTDTHRGDHLGVADQGVAVATPVLDRLAGDGVVFLDCFATTNFTNPSHVALMTGEHPRDTGIVTNHQALAAGAHTLAEHFADAGWATWAAVSARHLGHDVAGLGQGFERVSWPRQNERAAEASLDVLTRWLDEDEPRPLFVWLHVFDAHAPLEPPAEFAARYPVQAVDDVAPDSELPWLGEEIDIGLARARYKALVTYLDDQLDRVLGDRRLGNGIVAVVGDHGESLGQHRIALNHAGLYPDTLHVPLLLRWPGGPRGRRVERAVRQHDLGVTLLELAGLPAEGFGGRSLVGDIDGSVEPEPRFALAAHGGMASLTWQGQHLILHLVDHHGRWRRHETELYDLTVDRGCLHDLVEARPADAAKLRARLVDWLRAARPLGWVAERVEDPATLAQLEALGYLADERVSGPLWEADDCAWCQRFPR